MSFEITHFIRKKTCSIFLGCLSHKQHKLIYSKEPSYPLNHVGKSSPIFVKWNNIGNKKIKTMNINNPRWMDTAQRECVWTAHRDPPDAHWCNARTAEALSKRLPSKSWHTLLAVKSFCMSACMCVGMVSNFVQMIKYKLMLIKRLQ